MLSFLLIIKMNFQNHFVDFETWDDEGNYLYHYTTIKNARNIINSRIIHAFIPKISDFGKGVFLTPISPKKSDDEINQDLFNGSQNPDLLAKLQCCFAFSCQDLSHLEDLVDVDRLSWKRCVLKSSENIDLNEVNYAFILRPCSNMTVDDFLVS